MEKEIIELLEGMKKELQDIRRILEPPKFIPESSEGAYTADNSCENNA